MTILPAAPSGRPRGSPRCRRSCLTPRCCTGVVDLGDLATIRAFADGWLAERRLRRPRQQRRRDGLPARPHRRRLRDPVRHQPPRPLPAHGPAAAGAVAGDAPPVVTLSSAGHSRCDVDLDDPGFRAHRVLGVGRLRPVQSANALFAGSSPTATAARGSFRTPGAPGAIITDLGRHLTEDLMNEMMETARSGRRSTDTRRHRVEVGRGRCRHPGVAATSDDPELVGHNGAYLADCGLGVLGANPGANGMAPWSSTTRRRRSGTSARSSSARPSPSERDPPDRRLVPWGVDAGVASRGGTGRPSMVIRGAGRRHRAADGALLARTAAPRSTRRLRLRALRRPPGCRPRRRCRPPIPVPPPGHRVRPARRRARLGPPARSRPRRHALRRPLRCPPRRRHRPSSGRECDDRGADRPGCLRRRPVIGLVVSWR